MILPPWVSGIVLGVYGLLILYALFAPARQPDPQRGVAIGCLWIVFVTLLGVGALLTAGVLMRLPWLVNAISTVCLYSLFLLVLGLVKSGVDWFRNQR